MNPQNLVPASAVAMTYPRESISSVLTDSEALQTGANGRRMTLFKSSADAATGLPKTLYQTNMKRPGQLDRPESMDVHRIGVVVWPANGVGATSVTQSAVSLLISIVEDSQLVFTIGGSKKQYWNGPIHRLPAGVGLYTMLGRGTEAALTIDSAANIGLPWAKGMYPAKYKQHIEWSEPFQVDIEIGHNLPASFAGLGTAPRLFVVLEGVKHRGIQ